jgi:hypothetical protein
VDVRDLGLHGPQTIDGHSENKASYDGRLRFQGMSQMPIRRGLCSATVGGFDVVLVGAQMIARRQETAALRNLNPAYVRFVP